MENLMKKKWVICLLLSANLVLTTCLNPNQEDKINKETFIEIFKDLEYLKSKHEMGFIDDINYNKEFNYIFSSKKLNQDDFKKQMDQYLENLSDFELILNEVQSEIEINSK